MGPIVSGDDAADRRAAMAVFGRQAWSLLDCARAEARRHRARREAEAGLLAQNHGGGLQQRE
jgi:hypothetical protein